MNNVMETLFSKVSPDDFIKLRNKHPPPQLQKVGDPYTAYLHEEMRQCYLNGLDHAAIVTACALLEYSLKSCVFAECHLKANRQFDHTKWDAIDEFTLDGMISFARNLGIISKDDAKELRNFNATVRHDYMHGSTPKALKDETQIMTSVSLITGEPQRVEVGLRTDIALQRIFRLFYDRKKCEEVVRFVHRFAQKLQSERHERLSDWKHHNATFIPTREQLKKAVDNAKKQGVNLSLGLMADFPAELFERDSEDTATEMP